MELLDQPLASAEFLAVDTETNGRAGDECELTEVGAVLVGGGELHDRWGSLVTVSAPLSRGVQRFTGITQGMVDTAPPPDVALAELAALMRGRTLVAHSAGFDRRVLCQAFEHTGLDWPDPPVLCTVALARRLLPLQRRRKLAELADALGIEVALAHRALADAETCARVFCALFPKLRAHAASVGDAVKFLRARRTRRPSAPRGGRPPGARRALPQLDWGELPDDPGVYLFRDGGGRVLYVGKSVSVRTRARSHFTPSSVSGEWTAQATAIDYLGDALRARRARAREPPDQGPAPSGQREAARRPPLDLRALPLRHPVSGPRDRARAGRRPGGEHRAAARAQRRRRARGAARLALRAASLRPRPAAA